jgi:DNA repair photolyase
MASVPEIIELPAKSVLNQVSGMPFRWSINPYRGCSHGCVFCFARRTHWFLDEDGVQDWSSKIFVKINAPDVLRHEVSRPTWRREEVALGTATDPYQSVERKYQLTRRILAVLCEARTPVSIVTRSPMIVRDIDILMSLARRAGVTVCVSIATTDARVAREIEPTVALPAQRLAAVRRLSETGIRAGVLLAPVLPGITDAPESLDAVVCAAQEHGAHFVGHNALHLGDITRDAFFRFLRARHPGLVPRYERMYRGKYAPDVYRAEISEIVDASKHVHGIESRRYREPAAGEPPAQMALFTVELPRGRVHGAAARRRRAARAARRVPARLPVEVDVAEDGKAHRPGEHVGEFGGEPRVIAVPQRLGDLADLFNEAPKRAVDTADTVALPERRGNSPLKDGKVHSSPLHAGVADSKTA